MSKQLSKTIVFKHSILKILARLITGVILVVFGIFATFYVTDYFYTSNRIDPNNIEIKQSILRPNHTYIATKQSPLYWITGFTTSIVWIGGCVLIFSALEKFAGKRVFIKLTLSGLQHNEVYYRFRIPYVSETFIGWERITSISIKRNLIGTSIKLILTEKRNDKNRKYSISVSCSEYSAEYIMKTIYIYRKSLSPTF